MIKWIKHFLSYPEIQIALAFAIGILAQAYFYKYIYHIETDGLLILLPGLIFIFYETLYHDKKNRDKLYLKTSYWVIAITIANIISILIPYFRGY